MGERPGVAAAVARAASRGDLRTTAAGVEVRRGPYDDSSVCVLGGGVHVKRTIKKGIVA
jgi:hypothetical protein